MSSMVINDFYKPFSSGKLSERRIIFYTRACNVVFASIALAIATLGINIVTMNTFAFAIRCAGPFAAYGLGLVVPRATKHSGQISIVTGTIGVIFWQYLSAGDFYLGILPVVFGCFVGCVTFLLVNLIEWKLGIESSPSPFADIE